ncbi:SMR family transporter [Demequina sediminicola]|uniref:SMR family transporter n=1 Tax=Demequina sediminicola TaxID=1095026 RepID=UPI001F023BA5|nr:SMR family transporter [Demequina sediminicola]
MSLKGALTHPSLYAVVVTSYAGAFTMLALVLRAGVGLGVAYGIWAAAGVALTSVISKALSRSRSRGCVRTQPATTLGL